MGQGASADARWQKAAKRRSAVRSGEEGSEGGAYSSKGARDGASREPEMLCSLSAASLKTRAGASSWKAVASPDLADERKYRTRRLRKVALSRERSGGRLPAEVASLAYCAATALVRSARFSAFHERDAKAPHTVLRKATHGSTPDRKSTRL